MPATVMTALDSPFGSPFENASEAWRIPDGERPHDETIGCLRAIGGLGEVTNKELLALGYYLNEHRDARHSWPGERLVKVLAEMYSGHLPSKTDRDEIHTDLEFIERECARVAPPGEDIDDPLPLSSIKIEDVPLPMLNRTVTVECADSRTTFEADLHRQSCDCPTWPHARGKLKLNDIRRCCAHLVSAYHQMIENGELEGVQPVLKELMADRDRRGRSLDPHSRWKLLKIRMRPHIAIYGNGEWSYVYAPDAGGFSRFAYHNEQKRWSFGQPPKSAKTVELFFAEAVSGRINL